MKKVLIVEDNKMIQEILKERLLLRDYSVYVADNGEDGLQMALQEAPDVIIMDMSLPVIDGWEATRRLKATPETKHIPVIALTAHALVEDREKSFAAGCDEFETKPIDFQQLLEKIELFLNSS